MGLATSRKMFSMYGRRYISIVPFFDEGHKPTAKEGIGEKGKNRRIAFCYSTITHETLPCKSIS
jgi:hypothetical protein